MFLGTNHPKGTKGQFSGDIVRGQFSGSNHPGGNYPGQFSSGVVVRGDNFPQGQLSSGVIFWTAITWGQSSREGVAIFLGGNCPDTVFTLHIGSMLIYFVVVLETKKLLIHLLLTWLIYRSSY